MINADAVNPDKEATINGEKVSFNVGYGTIIEFERITGRSIGYLTNPIELVSPTIVAQFLHAALYSKDKKYTFKYIKEHLDQKLMKRMCDVIPKAINSALDFSQVEDEEESSGETNEKKDNLTS